MNYYDFELISANIRKDIAKMIINAGSGHFGGSLSAVELIVLLYFKHMKYDYNNNDKDILDRDYFILSKGHACPLLYAVLAELGFFEKKIINTFRKFGSKLQGHPAKDKNLNGIDVSTGSLGYGLSIGVGIAFGIKKLRKKNNVYVLMGDGEQQEGNVWESAMSASHFNLNNLCAIIDKNGLQLDGLTKDIMNIDPLVDKYKAFGWEVIEIDGHSFNDIDLAYMSFKKTKTKPTAIIAKTIKGKGISYMENNFIWHGKVPKSHKLINKAFFEIDCLIKKLKKLSKQVNNG
jgi:transketolase